MMNQTTSAVISARIVVLVSGGMALEAAVDQVLGAGTYAAIASDVYDALKGGR